MIKNMNFFENEIILYHGSKDIIEKSLKNKGKKNNDYGLGFYCTDNINLAKEWAVTRTHDGFANKYSLDINGLNILNLQDYDLIYWISILLENRDLHSSDNFLPGGKEFLIKNYHIDLSDYDIIVGYRADDSYFSYMRRFMSGGLSLEQLEDVLHYGHLGLQYVLISDKAFSRIKFLGYENALRQDYLDKKIKRDNEARNSFKQLHLDINGTFLLNILQGGDK